MQGNFGFIQTMRAMDQKSTGWSWYSQWSFVLQIGYALYALFISCPSNFSVFIWLGVSDAAGTGEAGAWVWDTPEIWPPIDSHCWGCSLAMVPYFFLPTVDKGPVNWWVFPGSVWNGAFFGCRPQKSDQSIRNSTFLGPEQIMEPPSFGPLDPPSGWAGRPRWHWNGTSENPQLAGARLSSWGGANLRISGYVSGDSRRKWEISPTWAFYVDSFYVDVPIIFPVRICKIFFSRICLLTNIFLPQQPGPW